MKANDTNLWRARETANKQKKNEILIESIDRYVKTLLSISTLHPQAFYQLIDIFHRQCHRIDDL